MSSRDEMTVGLQQSLHELLMAQPWYRRKANTITSLGTGVLTFLTWFGAFQMDLPTWATAALGALAFLAGVLAISGTKNGLTESVINQVANPTVVEAASRDRRPVEGYASEVVEKTAEDIRKDVLTLQDQATEVVQRASEQWAIQTQRITDEAGRTMRLTITPESK